jgi:hypothetical protein
VKMFSHGLRMPVTFAVKHWLLACDSSALW